MRHAFSDALAVTLGGNNIFDTYPDRWDEVDGAPFPQMGFKYGWETMPFGMNGGSYYMRMDYRF